MTTPGRRNDPLPVFCFKVQWSLGDDAAFFKSVGGLRYETEVVTVGEGGVNDTTFSLIGATKWSPLVFKKGFTTSSTLIRWREEWLNGKRTRINGTIIQLDTAMQAQAQWTFFRGWPTKWEISEFDAAKSELAIETLEIAHEGLQFSLPGQEEQRGARASRAGAVAPPRPAPVTPRPSGVGRPPSPQRAAEGMQLFREENGPPAGPRGPGVGAPPSPERAAEGMQLFREENGPPADEKPSLDELADELE